MRKTLIFNPKIFGNRFDESDKFLQKAVFHLCKISSRNLTELKVVGVSVLLRVVIWWDDFDAVAEFDALTIFPLRVSYIWIEVFWFWWCFCENLLLVHISSSVKNVLIFYKFAPLKSVFLLPIYAVILTTESPSFIFSFYLLNLLAKVERASFSERRSLWTKGT